MVPETDAVAANPAWIPTPVDVPATAVEVQGRWDGTVGTWGGVVAGGRTLLPVPVPGAGPDGTSHGGTIRIPGVILPRFIDSHVHLGLVDRDELFAGGIGTVVDLGWEPEAIANWRATEADKNALAVAYAGPFLSVGGGYPAHSGWAPPGSVVAISSAEHGATVVAGAVRSGSGCIKVTLNSEVGPVLDDAVLRAIVETAHGLDVPVVAHVQGAGQAARALACGVDVLAHTPWTEALSDRDIRAQAAAVTWISTLDIHGWGSYGRDFDVATRNLSRFAAAGGRVSYGTDLGNGPLPTGLNRRELAALSRAGLDGDRIVSALVTSPLAATIPVVGPNDLLSWLPTVAPLDPSDLADWLGTARLMTPSTLVEMFT